MPGDLKIHCTRCNRMVNFAEAFHEGWNIAIDGKKDLYNVRCPNCRDMEEAEAIRR